MNAAGSALARLLGIMVRLRAPDGGCPWDREQTFATIAPYTIEEAYEVADAIAAGDPARLRRAFQLATVQVVFQAELGRNEGSFGPDDVVEAICDKLVRRHPHVFGDVAVEGSGEVLRNWELIKAEEKKQKGKGEGILHGVPRSLPALVRAQRVGEKVARVGFDWADAKGSRAKVDEELGELERAMADGDQDAIEAELGDALFALVNLARHTKVDAEAALKRTIDKFTKRFDHVEARVHEVHGGWPKAGSGEQLSLLELDGYWEEAKR